MKVILTEDHDTLGLRGEVVEVKNGYGRNFLIPRRLAVVANRSNTKRYAEEQRQRQHKVEAQREQAAKLAEKIDGTEVVIAMRVGEEGRLFGSVTAPQVAEALEAKGITVDRRRLSLPGEVRAVGVYTATVRVSPEHTADVKVQVVPTEDSLDSTVDPETDAIPDRSEAPAETAEAPAEA